MNTTPPNELLHACLNWATSSNIHIFTQRVFQHINPNAEYQPNWHIDLIMEQLERVRRGYIKRLIINMPPRSLKSICASVAFPAWVLAHQPHKRIITTSYSLQLAKKHSLDCRSVIASKWYQELFPTRLAREQNDQFKFQTTDFGFRLATSVGGTLTGEGGDILILDDPINAAQAQSPQLRRRLSDWYQQTLVSRLDDKMAGAILLVMQRFHPDYLTGELLKTGHWHHLNLPLIATQKEHYTICGKPQGRRVGEVLHQGRDTRAYATKLREEIGPYAYQAQYQQTPITRTGEMIKREWFGQHPPPPPLAGEERDLASISCQRAQPEGRSGCLVAVVGESDTKDMPCGFPPKSPRKRGDFLPTNEDGGLIIQSWDTAIKSSPSSDYSVCITACLSGGVSHLLDVHRDRIEYPALKRRVLQQAERFSPDHILIEDKASGQQLIQDLKREAGLPIIPILPKGDKFSRISAATGMIEAGKVSLPNNAHWLAAFLEEVLSYPGTTFDDQIDALAQYLNWLRSRPPGQMSIRGL